MTVYGIDPSTRAVSLAVLSERGCMTHTRHIDPAGKLRGAVRCAKHYDALIDWLPLIGRVEGLPELVVVEQPMGAHVAPASLECLGVLLAALGATFTCPVVELVPPKWKQYALGNGSAGKPQIMGFARRVQGYVGSLQDEADAIGIACAADYLLSRDGRAA